jgi:ATP synthase protein I
MTDNTKQRLSPEKGSKREFIRFLGVASTVGINLVVSTFVGFAIGYWILDRFFNTFPWFTMIFLILGIAAGFRYLFKVALKQRDNGDSERGN